jgi:protein arginine kinase
MTIDDLLQQTGEWLKGEGPNSDIVLSSRTRLARNIDKYPFAHWAKDKQLADIVELVKNAASSIDILRDATFIRLKDVSEIDRIFLVERHLMSPEHAKDVEYKALIVDNQETVSIMIDEEDHLRIQVLKSGFDIVAAWKMIDSLDTELSKTLPFAFSSKWGYLTACPTNTGTGLRGSIMLHLPALVFSGQINKILQATAKLGLNVRGLYGEGTEAAGNLFQVSNQVSLGRPEEEIIDNLDRIISQIVGREEAMRKDILANSSDALADRVWRAYGTLKSAHIITSSETISLLSAIRLGVELGIVKDIDVRTVNELIMLTQPAHLQKLEGKALNSDERDVKRANLIREKLK